MTCCPYCREPVNAIRAGEDDSLDYCRTCDKIVEGATVEITDGE
jgi:uncharacterized protein YbaR (Trm112 family)